jgi:Tol biopolymer transport system component
LQQLGHSGTGVDLSVLRREGELAFVSRNELFLVDAGSIRRISVPSGWTAFAPTFSYDGRWVAYELEDRSANGEPKPPTFWVARGDGSDPHRIAGVDTSFGWSPTRDLLAVSTDTIVRFPSGARGETPTRIDLISPTGARTRLLTLSGKAEATAANGYQVDPLHTILGRRGSACRYIA